MKTRTMRNYIVKDAEVRIGLEVAKRSWKVCARSEGIEVHLTSMPGNYGVFASYLKSNYPGCRTKVLYEAGFSGFGLRDRLVADGFECVVLPPHLVTEEKVNNVKTDRRDARRLAKICETNDYRSECFVPDRERREDRQTSRTLIGVQKDIIAVKNRIRKFFDFHSIENFDMPDSKQTWSPKAIGRLKSIAMSQSLRLSLDCLIRILEMLCDERRKLRNALRALTKKPRYARAFELIHSVCGVGWYTAIRLVLELGEDLSRFTNGGKIATFVGLTGTEFSTGDSVRRGCLPHSGKYVMRPWLIQCAWAATKKDPALMEKYRRIRRSTNAKDGAKKAIVAVARTLIVRIRACVLSNTPYVVGVVQ